MKPSLASARPSAIALGGAPPEAPAKTRESEGAPSLGPSGYRALEPSGAAAALGATLEGARALLERVVDGFNALVEGAPLTEQQANTALSVLRMLQKIGRDLSGALGSTPDASHGDLRELRADVAGVFAAFRERIEASPSGDVSKARILAEGIVGLQSSLLPPDRPPSVTAGAIPALPMNAEAWSFAESAGTNYERAAGAQGHFFRTVYHARVEADLARVEARAQGEPGAAAFVQTMRGLLAQLFGGYEDAVHSHQGALALMGGNNASLAFNLATALAGSGQQQQALHALETAIGSAATTEEADAIRARASQHPALWRLISEAAYHQLLASIGGPKLAVMPGVEDHRGHPLYQSRPWRYEVLLSGRYELDEEFAKLREQVYQAQRTSISLCWDGADGTVVAERSPAAGAFAEVPLATLTERQGSFEVQVQGADRLYFDPAVLHRWLSALKLWDEPGGAQG